MSCGESKHFHRTETLIFLLLTIWGVAQGQVTVFYIIYLFWFRELTRTIIDILYAYRNGKEDGKQPGLKEICGNILILFIYLVFIVLLFGFMLNWNNRELLFTNMQTLVFRNLCFNLNVSLFILQYALYRKSAGKKGLDIAVFGKSHIILHISIIVGALIQMGFVKRYPGYFSGGELWGSALVVLPFLLLKIWIGRAARNS